jgi:hypothetical protein
VCRKYEVAGETLTLDQIRAKLEGRPHIRIPEKVVYSQHEIVSARTVLDRLALKAAMPAPRIRRKVA